MDRLYSVLAFDLEFCNVKNSKNCESLAAGVYYLNSLYECFNGDLNQKELAFERSKDHAFDRKRGNPLSKTIDNVIIFFERNAKFITNRHGERILSSYKNQNVVQNASEFDNYNVLSSLPNSNKCIKIMKTSRGLIKLSFKAGSVIEDDKRIPKYMNSVCSKCHISGSLKEIQKEYKIQPNLMKEQFDHKVINFSNYKDYGTSYKPYFMGDVLGLVYVVARQSNRIQKITSVSYKNSLTEASLR